MININEPSAEKSLTNYGQVSILVNQHILGLKHYHSYKIVIQANQLLDISI